MAPTSPAMIPNGATDETGTRTETTTCADATMSDAVTVLKNVEDPETVLR